MRLACKIAGLLLCALCAWGQITPARDPRKVTSDPTGACTAAEAVQHNTANGKLCACNNGTWGCTPINSVTAASVFGTDNVVVRADGTGRGAQASGCTLDDADLLTCPGGLASGGTGAGQITLKEIPANGENFRRWTVPDLLGADLTFMEPNAVPTAGQVKRWTAPSAGVSTGSFSAAAGVGACAAKQFEIGDNNDAVPTCEYIRSRSHASDCTALTDGKEGETCYEQDADTFYVCEPTAGLCDTAAEWRQIGGAGSNHNLLSATHSDTVAGSPVRGGIVAANSTPAWAQLALGAAKKVATSDGTDLIYQFIRLRSHATDCTALTDGNEGEACFEQDSNAIYICEPTAGLCDTAGEWTQASGGSAGFAMTTADQGGYFPGMGNFPVGVAGAVAVGSANEIRMAKFVLPFNLLVTQIGITVSTLSAGGTASLCVYNTSGTRQVTTGGFSTTSTGNQTLTVGTPPTLTAGIYWLAYTIDNTVAQLEAYSVSGNTALLMDTSQIWRGVSVTSATAGVCPASATVPTSNNANVYWATAVMTP